MKYYELIYDKDGLLEGFEVPWEVIPPRVRKKLMQKGIAETKHRVFLSGKRMEKFLKDIRKSKLLYKKGGLK